MPTDRFPPPPPSRWHPPRDPGLVPLPRWLLRRLGARTTLDPARVDRLRRALHEGIRSPMRSSTRRPSPGRSSSGPSTAASRP
jgi:hypothetical protein